jgi:hypothetical protein
MTRKAPRFPPAVAAALQQPVGRVSVRYTLPESLLLPSSADVPLMSTPYERVLATIALDTKRNVRFVRTGDHSEGTRAALASVDRLLTARSRRWQITLSWDHSKIAVEVEDATRPADSASRDRADGRHAPIGD